MTRVTKILAEYRGHSRVVLLEKASDETEFSIKCVERTVFPDKASAIAHFNQLVPRTKRLRSEE